MTQLLGVHCSVSGGLINAFLEANKLGINTFQIFTRNQRQWKAKPISTTEASEFREAMELSGIKHIFSHCSYLINLAAENEDIRQKSLQALQEEVERCTELGLKFCVLHPGAAGSRDYGTAMEIIAEGLQQVLKATVGSPVKIALENTAGQGTSVGGPLENLRQISDIVGSNRIGYCIDTCHAFVQGYDIRTEKSSQTFWEHIDIVLGHDNLLGLHINDSKGKLGSHLDRHAHVGEGELGLEPFRYILQNFPHIPKVLETPKENDMDEVNLGKLRGLV